MNLSDLISTDSIIPNLASRDKISVLGELVAPLCRLNEDLDPDQLVKILIERERLGSTGIGDGIAIPHGKVEKAEKLLISFGRSVEGIEFDSMDSKPAHLFFLLLAPESSAGSHLTALAKLSRLLKNSSVREHLMEAGDAEEIHSLIVGNEEGI